MMKIKSVNLDRFDEVYGIMEKSFPPDEMRPYSEQRELLQNEKYKVFAATDDASDKITAFVAT